MSADTMCGVVLGDVLEVFTHPFTQSSFSMSNILFESYLTCNALNNGVGLATTAPNCVVVATRNRTSDVTRSV